MNLKIVIPLMLAAIAVPIGVAICSNWSNLQSFLASDAATTQGELYFFTDRRG